MIKLFGARVEPADGRDRNEADPLTSHCSNQAARKQSMLRALYVRDWTNYAECNGSVAGYQNKSM